MFLRNVDCYTTEDDILHNHRCENLKSYIDDSCMGLSVGQLYTRLPTTNQF
jgi:hypothetical protein